MARFLDAWFGLSLLIVGCSHAAQPRLWADFFAALKRTGFAPLVIGMYTLPTGLALVVGHNDWAWDWPVIATVAGWGMTIKSTIYFVAPSIPNRMIDNAGRWQASFGVFRVVGAVMVVLGLGLTWHAYGHLPTTR